MAREFAAVLEQAEQETAWLGTGRERLVASAIRCVDLLATNPVLVRILELDGERLLPYFTGTPGASSGSLTSSCSSASRAARRRDRCARATSEELAGTVELALRGVVLSGHAMAAEERAAALRELARMLDLYLRPESRPARRHGPVRHAPAAVRHDPPLRTGRSV